MKSWKNLVVGPSITRLTVQQDLEGAAAAASAHQHSVIALDAGGPCVDAKCGQHQAETCRMGTDPATSVTDPYGRVWGHPNLRVIDGSLHVTNGGVNPVLTIFANAFRIMHTWVGSGRDYL